VRYRAIAKHITSNPTARRDILELIEGEKETWDVEHGNREERNEIEQSEHNIS
jgi:hypothetical protein